MKLLTKNGFIKDEGFSLIEALVSIVILGLLSSIFFSFLSNTINKPVLTYRAEALVLAQNEIQRTIAARNLRDTSYCNMKGNMTIYKHVTENESLYKINVVVLYNNKIELINLPFTVKR
jgi:prepilin-type N-terminal cleavage/methylation domain-containing protein